MKTKMLIFARWPPSRKDAPGERQAVGSERVSGLLISCGSGSSYHSFGRKILGKTACGVCLGCFDVPSL